MNEIYDSVLITLGLVGLLWSTNKILKLGDGVTASTLLVKWVQSNKWNPTNPFKT